MLGFSAIAGFDAATGAPTPSMVWTERNQTNIRGRPIRWRIRRLTRCRSTPVTNLPTC
jgi:hypothetical protein